MKILVTFRRVIEKSATIEMSPEQYEELHAAWDNQPREDTSTEHRIESMIAETPEQDSGFVLEVFREQLY